MDISTNFIAELGLHPGLVMAIALMLFCLIWWVNKKFDEIDGLIDKAKKK